MTVWLALAVATPFALLAWLAVWSRAGTWGRPAAVALFLFSLPLIAGAGVQSLGQHRPYEWAWELPDGDHIVLSAKMIQDEAIYLYLDAGRDEPWPLVLPWSNEMANQIQEAMDGSEGQGNEGEGRFMARMDRSLDDNPLQFHPMPQSPVLPAKPAQQQAPHFEQPGT